MPTTAPPVLAQSPLKHVLTKRGVAQRWLAERTGISPSDLSRIVRGLIPTTKEAVAIAAALELEVADLWRLEGDEPESLTTLFPNESDPAGAPTPPGRNA